MKAKDDSGTYSQLDFIHFPQWINGNPIDTV
jgi:hypothetical protein